MNKINGYELKYINKNKNKHTTIETFNNDIIVNNTSTIKLYITQSNYIYDNASTGKIYVNTINSSNYANICNVCPAIIDLQQITNFNVTGYASARKLINIMLNISKYYSKNDPSNGVIIKFANSQVGFLFDNSLTSTKVFIDKSCGESYDDTRTSQEIYTVSGITEIHNIGLYNITTNNTSTRIKNIFNLLKLNDRMSIFTISRNNDTNFPHSTMFDTNDRVFVPLLSTNCNDFMLESATNINFSTYATEINNLPQIHCQRFFDNLKYLYKLTTITITGLNLARDFKDKDGNTITDKDGNTIKVYNYFLEVLFKLPALTSIMSNITSISSLNDENNLMHALVATNNPSSFSLPPSTSLKINDLICKYINVDAPNNYLQGFFLHNLSRIYESSDINITACTTNVSYLKKLDLVQHTGRINGLSIPNKTNFIENIGKFTNIRSLLLGSGTSSSFVDKLYNIELTNVDNLRYDISNINKFLIDAALLRTNYLTTETYNIDLSSKIISTDLSKLTPFLSGCYILNLIRIYSINNINTNNIQNLGGIKNINFSIITSSLNGTIVSLFTFNSLSELSYSIFRSILSKCINVTIIDISGLSPKIMIELYKVINSMKSLINIIYTQYMRGSSYFSPSTYNIRVDNIYNLLISTNDYLQKAPIIVTSINVSEIINYVGNFTDTLKTIFVTNLITCSDRNIIINGMIDIKFLIYYDYINQLTITNDEKNNRIINFLKMINMCVDMPSIDLIGFNYNDNIINQLYDTITQRTNLKTVNLLNTSTLITSNTNLFVSLLDTNWDKFTYNITTLDTKILTNPVNNINMHLNKFINVCNKLRNLTSISLFNIKFNTSDQINSLKTAINNNKNLQTLEIINCSKADSITVNFDDMFINTFNIINFTALTKLRIENSTMMVSSSMINKIIKNYNLTELYLPNCKLDETNIYTLVNKLRTNNNTLEKFDISNNSILDKHLHLIASALPQNITDIYLYNNNITSDGLRPFANATINYTNNINIYTDANDSLLYNINTQLIYKWGSNIRTPTTLTPYIINNMTDLVNLISSVTITNPYYIDYNNIKYYLDFKIKNIDLTMITSSEYMTTILKCILYNTFSIDNLFLSLNVEYPKDIIFSTKVLKINLYNSTFTSADINNLYSSLIKINKTTYDFPIPLIIYKTNPLVSFNLIYNNNIYETKILTISNNINNINFPTMVSTIQQMGKYMIQLPDTREITLNVSVTSNDSQYYNQNLTSILEIINTFMYIDKFTISTWDPLYLPDTLLSTFSNLNTLVVTFNSYSISTNINILNNYKKLAKQIIVHPYIENITIGCDVSSTSNDQYVVDMIKYLYGKSYKSFDIQFTDRKNSYLDIINNFDYKSKFNIIELDINGTNYNNIHKLGENVLYFDNIESRYYLLVPTSIYIDNITYFNKSFGDYNSFIKKLLNIDNLYAAANNEYKLRSIKCYLSTTQILSIGDIYTEFTNIFNTQNVILNTLTIYDELTADIINGLAKHINKARNLVDITLNQSDATDITYKNYYGKSYTNFSINNIVKTSNFTNRYNNTNKNITTGEIPYLSGTTTPNSSYININDVYINGSNIPVYYNTIDGLIYLLNALSINIDKNLYININIYNIIDLIKLLLYNKQMTSMPITSLQLDNFTSDDINNIFSLLYQLSNLTTVNLTTVYINVDNIENCLELLRKVLNKYSSITNISLTYKDSIDNSILFKSFWGKDYSDFKLNDTDYKNDIKNFTDVDYIELSIVSYDDTSVSYNVNLNATIRYNLDTGFINKVKTKELNATNMTPGVINSLISQSQDIITTIIAKTFDYTLLANLYELYKLEIITLTVGEFNTIYPYINKLPKLLNLNLTLSSTGQITEDIYMKKLWGKSYTSCVINSSDITTYLKNYTGYSVITIQEQTNTNSIYYNNTLDKVLYYDDNDGYIKFVQVINLTVTSNIDSNIINKLLDQSKTTINMLSFENYNSINKIDFSKLVGTNISNLIIKYCPVDLSINKIYQYANKIKSLNTITLSFQKNDISMIDIYIYMYFFGKKYINFSVMNYNSDTDITYDITNDFAQKPNYYDILNNTIVLANIKIEYMMFGDENIMVYDDADGLIKIVRYKNITYNTLLKDTDLTKANISIEQSKDILESLTISYNSLTPNNITIPTLNNITQLSLKNVIISGTPFNNFTNITKLALDNVRGIDFNTIITNNKKLTELSLVNNRITDAMLISYNLNNINLSRLVLNNNRITFQDNQYLTQRLPTTLNIIELNNNRITDVGVWYLIKQLQNTCFTQIDITMNNITTSGITLMTNFISSKSTSTSCGYTSPISYLRAPQI